MSTKIVADGALLKIGSHKFSALPIRVAGFGTVVQLVRQARVTKGTKPLFTFIREGNNGGHEVFLAEFAAGATEFHSLLSTGSNPFNIRRIPCDSLTSALETADILSR